MVAAVAGTAASALSTVAFLGDFIVECLTMPAAPPELLVMSSLTVVAEPFSVFPVTVSVVVVVVVGDFERRGISCCCTDDDTDADAGTGAMDGGNGDKRPTGMGELEADDDESLGCAPLMIPADVARCERVMNLKVDHEEKKKKTIKNYVNLFFLLVPPISKTKHFTMKMLLFPRFYLLCGRKVMYLLNYISGKGNHLSGFY